MLMEGPRHNDLPADRYNAVIDAVAEIVVERGYVALTMTEVASRLNWPVEEVVRAGPKPDLVMKACRATGIGNSEWAEVIRNADLQRAIDTEDNEQAVRHLVAFLAAENPRRHALWLGARFAANQEPRLVPEFEELCEGRKDLFLLISGLMIARGLIPTTSAREEFALHLGAVISVEMYEFLSQIMCFDTQRYAEWMQSTLDLLFLAWNARPEPDQA